MTLATDPRQLQQTVTRLKLKSVGIILTKEEEKRLQLCASITRKRPSLDTCISCMHRHKYALTSIMELTTARGVEVGPLVGRVP